MRRLEGLRPALLAALVVVLAASASALVHPLGAAVGAADGEAPVHLWSLWVAADGLAEHGPFLRVAPVSWPAGFSAHLMDPANLLVFAPIYRGTAPVLGAAEAARLAWNALHLLAPAAAAAGSVALARELFGAELRDRSFALALPVLVFAFAGSAWLVHHADTGRTELLPAVLWPAHLAALHRALGPRGGARQALGAGLVLGLMGLGGWYLVVFLAVLEAPLLAAWAWRLRPPAARLALVVAAPAAMVAPALVALLRHPPLGVSLGDAPLPAWGESVPDVVFGLERLLRLPGASMARPLESPAYFGLVVLALGLLGAALRPRLALPWLALGLWGVSWAAGPFLVMGPQQAPWFVVPGPAGLAERTVPPLRAMNAWPRMACLLPLPFGVAAFVGARALLSRARGAAWQLAVVLAVAVVLDGATFGGTPAWTRRSFAFPYDGRTAALLDSLGPGGLVELPLDISLDGARHVHGRYLLWQRRHGRPVTASPPNEDAALAFSTVARLAGLGQAWLAAPTGPAPFPLDGRADPLDPERLACARADRAALAERGIAWVVLHRDVVPGPSLEPMLRQVMGPPAREVATAAAWSTAEPWPGEGAAPRRCAKLTVSPILESAIPDALADREAHRPGG